MTDTVLSASKLDELLSKGAWDARPGPGATFSLSITAIAAGAEPAGAGKLKLSVTLVMQPVVGSAYDLAKLPTAIAEQAGDIDIVLISSEGEKLVAAKLTVGNVSTEDATIGDLWRRLMAPNGGVDWWHETAKQLPLAKPETEGGAPKTPPPIIPVPRGEAAVSLVLRRAKRVRDRRDIIKTPGTKPGSDLDGGNELDMVVGFDGRTKISQEELEKTARDRIRKTVVGFVKTEIASAKELMNKLKANIKLDEAANEAIGACRLSSDETKSPSDMAMAVCDGNSEKCKNRNAVQRSLHYAATAEDGTKPPDGTTKNAEAAQRRLMALDALPRLARLFNLVVDGHVVIDMVALGGATWKEKFVSVTAKLPEADGADNVWTQAKISKADEGNAIGPQFWPCTQEELDAASLAGGCTDVFRPAISQRNGIMDLGVTESKGAITSPRYDIATVDTIAGVEGEMNQELAKATRKENNVGEDPGGDGAITLRTVGLCLVDRWRRDTAIKTVLRAAECRALSGATLDADALQIGWRLDVGTEGAGGKIVWRSLCNRFIDYYDPKEKPATAPGKPCTNWVEKKLLDRFAAEEQQQRRYDLDAAYISSPMRSAKHDLESDGQLTDVLHVDDIIAQWEGDPLGVECSRHLTFSYPELDLAVTQVHKLVMLDRSPAADPAHKAYLPPPLRFGQRYRLAARAVYRGGVVQPLKNAEALYSAMLGGTAVLPPAGRLGRTFRRHERISPVIVTQSRYRIENWNGKYPLPQSRSAVLREADAVTSERRILVAPFVGQAFAALHGVFDEYSKEDITINGAQSRPRDGLRDVHFAAEPLGGFPVLTSKGKIETNIGEVKKDGNIEIKKHLEGILRGDVVFDVTPGGGGDVFKRRVPYYPDPAARLMVLRALRTLDKKPFAGDPIVIKLYGPGIKYPDVLPVVLDIERASNDPKPEFDTRKHSDILEHTDKIGGLNKAEVFYETQLKGMVAVKRVKVKLLPGDDITIECWCIPDLSRLRHWFDVVESIALLDAVGASKEADPNAAFECIQPLPVACVPDAKDGATCGAGGLKAVSEQAVKDIAKTLDEALRQAPIPDISSVQWIQAVYAIKKPRFAPVHAPPNGNGALTCVRRLNHDVKAWEAYVSQFSPDEWEDDADATDGVFGGMVKADLDTSDSIVLMGSFASPETDRLDDPRRGFSREQLKEYLKLQAGGTPTANAIDLSTDDTYFGFCINKSGTVTFKRQKVPLLTLRNLAPTDRTTYASVEDVDLLCDLKKVEASPGKQHNRPMGWRYKFKDTLARHLKVSLQSTPRFDDLFVDTNRNGLEPKPDRTGEAAHTREIWLNATRRPSRIEPKSLLPAFVWKVEGAQIERRTVVRVRFKRPWFSSGEGEQLGVVILPVDMFEKSAGDLARSPYVSDTELGPGGSYVTRWGADPIRKGPTPDRWLVPHEVFADYHKDRFIKNVLMPLPADNVTTSGALKAEVSLAEDPPKTLRVALLTYEPKFDPVQALWYVDMALDALDLPDPFLRLGLVRYQKHAAEPLRVSEPVVEWVQLLPRRTVRWSYVEPSGADKRVGLKIEISGPGSLRAAVEDSPVTRPGDKPHERDRPLMRATVSVRRQLHDTSLFDERTLLCDDDKLVACEDGKPRRSADGLSWTLTLRFKTGTDPRKKEPGVSYRVYVEEVVRMLSSTHDTTENDETGVRFAVDLEV